MAKKLQIKTAKTTTGVAQYLNSIEPAGARADAKRLAKLFKAATGAKPKMWGTTMLGYGEYIYYRANGDEGVMMATGFSARKSGPVLYVIPGYSKYAHVLKKLGPHKLGKSCLYLKNLKDIDLDTVSELISLGIKDLKKSNQVKI